MTAPAEVAPRDTTFFLCFAGFLGGLLVVVVAGALMRNWVQDNDDELDPDVFSEIPWIGGVLLLFYAFGRYAKLRRAAALPLVLTLLAGALVAGASALVLELR